MYKIVFYTFIKILNKVINKYEPKIQTLKIQTPLPI